ncbi:hypothetical protein [Hymenobacter wooponensis]|uniref:Uncharacterized protein n=1 Tax=Hymenobacter wooponensis TaxID=1525360 RepID=A0A4Z0MCX3_9BACT|nr:hypothetical protein [Hymenobacter wooponensis]TGD77592.1 hypothetical protein EU557_22720 [Hymenobacter wooponensis]
MPLPATPSPTLTTAAMLRLLRQELLQLPAHTPYWEARLRRLTDQLTFVVQTWSGIPWPTHSRQGDEVPSAAHVLTLLAHLPAEPAARQRTLLVLVLLLL